MVNALHQSALDQTFAQAHTTFAFTPQEVSDATLKQIYDLCCYGPTAFNAQPMRVVFVKSAAAKAKLKPALMPGNQDKTMAAPVTALIAYDLKFYQHLSVQFPAMPDTDKLFTDNPALVESTAFRNGTLQGAYFMVAARMLGLAVGPMSGFNAEQINQSFFGDTSAKVNFICNIGYAAENSHYPRGPRLAFNTIAKIV